MIADIMKALKALDEEATIVKIILPEQISEDTRERLKQVVTHFKAVSMKGTGNYVLCLYPYDIYKPMIADYEMAILINDIGFLVFRVIYNAYIDRYFAILATDTGRDVMDYLVEDYAYRRMKVS